MPKFQLDPNLMPVVSKTKSQSCKKLNWQSATKEQRFSKMVELNIQSVAELQRTNKLKRVPSAPAEVNVDPMGNNKEFRQLARKVGGSYSRVTVQDSSAALKQAQGSSLSKKFTKKADRAALPRQPPKLPLIDTAQKRISD